MKGYDPKFLGTRFPVPIPDYGYYKNNVAINQQTNDPVIDYIYYSVIQSIDRRVPIISASNIFRTAFLQNARTGDFKRDKRIAENEQLTDDDYSRFNSIIARAIAKGHMTKREDVQWDRDQNNENAIMAAKQTFYYPNASPQHTKLNNGIWKELENSIIIKSRMPIPAKVSVFTGPVLDPDDPEFKVNLNDGTPFKIPVLFWKVVYYVKPDKKLYYAGFLMGQADRLRKDKLIKEKRIVTETLRTSSLKPFLEFEDDEKYQVPISMIEELTDLRFSKAIDRHEKDRPVKLVLKDVQVTTEAFRPGNALTTKGIVEGLNV